MRSYEQISIREIDQVMKEINKSKFKLDFNLHSVFRHKLRIVEASIDK